MNVLILSAAAKVLLVRAFAEAVHARGGKVVGRRVEEIKLPKGATIGAIVRGQDVIMGHHDTLIGADARVIVLLTDRRHVAAVERHPAMVDLGEAGNGTQQRALAAAAGAEQHQELALADVQGNVVDDRGSLVPLGYLIEDDGHAQVTELIGIFMPS